MLSLIRPGWPDQARMLAQLPTLKRLTRKFPLQGACLNAGCGEGLYCNFLESFKNINNIYNVDIEQTNLVIKRLIDIRQCALDASITSLPFENSRFDSCICTEVLEHIQDDNAAVAELARCLRPGARLLLSVPHPPAPFDPAHIREGYTLEDLSLLLAKHGFLVVASERCFSVWMAWLLSVWRWQYKSLGKNKRNYMPIGIVKLFGFLDILIPIGHRWDLVVLAIRN